MCTFKITMFNWLLINKLFIKLWYHTLFARKNMQCSPVHMLSSSLDSSKHFGGMSLRKKLIIFEIENIHTNPNKSNIFTILIRYIYKQNNG